jgi:hypothetical protein
MARKFFTFMLTTLVSVIIFALMANAARPGFVPLMPIARPSILLESGDMCGGVAWCVNRAGTVGVSLCRNTTAPWGDVACKSPLTCINLDPKNNTIWACIGPI